MGKVITYSARQNRRPWRKFAIGALLICAFSAGAGAHYLPPVSLPDIDLPTITRLPLQETERCLIKGNVSRDGQRIYHLPGQKYYGATRISRMRGERWFCTEREALLAGWRKSRV